MPVSKSIICPILIGRASILESLDQFIGQINDRAESSSVILISGGAGVGKSRLVAEIKSRVARQGWGILQGNCFEMDRALPYAPLLDLLRAFCAAHSKEQIERAFGAVAPELVKLLPELNQFLPDLSPSTSLEPEPEKRRLFHALAQSLTQLIADQPRLILIEDLHGSDDASLEFLLYLTRQLAARSARSALLITYRSDEVHPTLAHLLAELDRGHLAVEFSLPCLSQPEAEAMLRAIFSQSRPVRAEFLNVIYSLTAGNPFFIEEVLKALIVSGEIFYVESEGIWDRKPLSELQIPRSIEDTMRRRAEQLSDAARQVLTLAAVAGRRFDFELLQRLTQPFDSDHPERGERELLSILKELINAQLLIEESADHFSFRHALTRQAIYSRLLTRERRSLHLQAAQAIEQMHSNSTRLDSHVEELAYHFYEAGVWDKALAYSQHAGEKAQSLYAPRQAVEQFTRAINAAQQAALEPSLKLYEARGRAYEDLAEFEQARVDYQTMLDGARARGDQHLEWEAFLALGALWSGRDFARGGDYYQRAQAIANELNDSVAMARTLNSIGNWHLNLGRPFDALGYHQQALIIFGRLQDQRGRAQTLDLLGITHYVCGDLVKGTACYEESLALFHDLNDRQGMINSMTYLSIRSQFTTERLDVPSVAQLIPPGETALKLARDLNWQSAETAISSCLAHCYGALGEYGRALDLAQTALVIAEEIQHPEWIGAARWAIGHVYHEIYAESDAQRQLETAFALARASSSVLYLQDIAASLALTYISRENYEEAETILAGILAASDPKETWGQRLCRCAEAELALATGKPARALEIIDRLIASAANVEADDSRVIPRLTFIRGLALKELHQLDAAEIELQAASKKAAAEGRLNLLRRIQGELGLLYLGRKRSDAAEREFTSSRAIVHKLASAIEEQSFRERFVNRALDSIPAPPTRSPRRIAKLEYSGLTEREREVAVLISLGKSNREIAEELVVSERTAATHVSNILSKLSFSSRAQIAAWAVDNGLAKHIE